MKKIILIYNKLLNFNRRRSKIQKIIIILLIIIFLKFNIKKQNNIFKYYNYEREIITKTLLVKDILIR